MLFKILKGHSSRIDLNTTSFHEGWSYFTPDDGKFYIDAVVNGENRRICINPDSGGSSYYDRVLTVTGWSNNRQTITIEGLRQKQNGFVGLSQDVSTAEFEDASAAEIRVCGQADGSFTVAYFGDKPTCDIPITVIVLA